MLRIEKLFSKYSSKLSFRRNMPEVSVNIFFVGLVIKKNDICFYLDIIWQRWALPIELRYSDSYRTKKKYRNIGLTYLSDFNCRTSSIGIPMVRLLSCWPKSIGLKTGDYSLEVTSMEDTRMNIHSVREYVLYCNGFFQQLFTPTCGEHTLETGRWRGDEKAHESSREVVVSSASTLEIIHVGSKTSWKERSRSLKNHYASTTLF